MADLLHEEAGIRNEDVFINLVEMAKENWSFGNGDSAVRDVMAIR